MIIENDWSDDISIPTGIDPRDIERKETAKSMADSWKRICLEIVTEMVMRAESMSTGSHIMNMVLEGGQGEHCQTLAAWG